MDVSANWNQRHSSKELWHPLPGTIQRAFNGADLDGLLGVSNGLDLNGTDGLKHRSGSKGAIDSQVSTDEECPQMYGHIDLCHKAKHESKLEFLVCENAHQSNSRWMRATYRLNMSSKPHVMVIESVTETMKRNA